MDLATIVMTALVLVFQIVLIALVVDTRKKINKNEPEEKIAPADMQDMRKPKEIDNRFNKRPANEHRNRPPVQAQQNVDHVERSLRDINLRLKNAEKDQEKERKRIKDAIGPSDSQNPLGHKKIDHPKPRNNNEGFRRNDRPPRHDYNQNRNSDPQRNRGEKVNNRNTEVSESQPFLATQPVIQQVTPAMVKIPMVTSPLPPAPVQAVVEPVITPAADVAVVMNENLQHGRKVMVKRRVLNLEEENQNESGDAV
ncbi:MAG TPA: hypothetical protein DCO75_05690, partial [Fibrobacteres bacterium]|nr:hypothetical protein [Fibrobacterota bacterium]